jgi:hypothetical protein
MVSSEPDLPLLKDPVEHRKFTYAVQVPLTDLISESVDIEELEFGSDALELVVELAELDVQFQTLMPNTAEQISSAISRIRRSTIVPIIYHVTPLTNHWSTTTYLEHVRHGLRMAPEFATVDLSLDEDSIRYIIRSQGSTKIIGHLHTAVSWYDRFWTEKYDTAM